MLFWLLTLTQKSRETHFHQAYPQLPTGNLAINSARTLEEVRAAGRERDVDTIYLSSLWYSMHAPPPVAGQPWKMMVINASPGEDYYRILDEFPNLRQVEYTCYGETPIGFDRVTQLKNIEYLTLYGRGLDLAPLKSWQKLRRIEIYSDSPPLNLAALAELPNLETIVFHSRMGVSGAVLSDLAKLPRLQTLVLDFAYHFPFEKHLSESDFAQLARSPSLSLLYVGGLQAESRLSPLRVAKAALPHMHVKASVYDELPWPARLLPLVPFELLTVIVGIQLSSQFRSPLTRLAPRYRSSHAIIGISLALIAIVCCGMWFPRVVAQVCWDAALAPAAAVVASGIGCMSLTSLRPATPPIRARCLTYVPMTIALGAMSLMCSSELFDRALRGRDPWLLTMLWGGTVIAGGVTVSLLNRLPSWAASSGAVPAKTRDQVLVSSTYRESWLFAKDRREMQIESWHHREATDWTWWQRVQRWRLGNRGLRVAPAIILVLLMAVFQVPTILQVGLERYPLSSALCFFALGTLGMAALHCGGIWRMRLQVLPLEITRPLSRHDILLEWMAAFVVDLVPGAVLASAIAALGVNIQTPLQIRWNVIPIDFALLFPIALATSVSLAATLVVIGRMWLALLAFFGLTCLISLIPLWMALVINGTPNNWEAANLAPRLPLSYAWAGGLMGLLLAGIMGRRFLRMEIGQRA
jgi:hypothetical protein